MGQGLLTIGGTSQHRSSLYHRTGLLNHRMELVVQKELVIQGRGRVGGEVSIPQGWALVGQGQREA